MLFIPSMRGRLRVVKLTKYHPSIRRLQEDFAARVARRKYTAARGPRPAPSKITDNSVPWLENPNSVADYWYIASKVNERVESWKALQTVSSAY